MNVADLPSRDFSLKTGDVVISGCLGEVDPTISVGKFLEALGEKGETPRDEEAGAEDSLNMSVAQIADHFS